MITQLDWGVHLRDWAASQEVSPWLVVGPLDSDWPAFLAFAKRLFVCEAGSGQDGCRGCGLVERGLHPDVVELERESASHKIGLARDFMAQTARRPGSGRRLLIIPEAHLLTLEAANMTLKHLEETTQYNRFLLTSAYRGRVLPTIRSRCQIIRIPQGFEPLMATEAPVEIESLLDLKRTQPFGDDELGIIYAFLKTKIMQGAYDRHVVLCLRRLRDYYQVQQLRGNTKMATDVLLASLWQLRKDREVGQRAS